MTTHELKIWPQYFEVVLDGSKTFEVRKDDRGYQVGDTLVLREWVPYWMVDTTAESYYTGRECQRTVTYILHGPAFGIEDGYVVMGIQRDVGAHRAHYEDPALWSAYATLYEVGKHMRMHGLSDDDILDAVRRQLAFANAERVNGGDGDDHD